MRLQLTLAMMLTGFGGWAVQAEEPKALLERALKAQGGEDKLAKFKASTGKIKGTSHDKGQALSFRAEGWFQGADQQKYVLEIDVCGQKTAMTVVLNRDQGWQKIGEETDAMSAEEIAEAKEEAYASWVATLVPLKGEGFTLTPLPDAQVEGRPAVGFQVAHKGRRDLKLWFDKETALLARMVQRVKDEESGEEKTEETTYRDWKEEQGVKQARAFTVKRDGKLYMEAAVTELRLLEKLDDKVFAKPE